MQRCLSFRRDVYGDEEAARVQLQVRTVDTHRLPRARRQRVPSVHSDVGAARTEHHAAHTSRRTVDDGHPQAVRPATPQGQQIPDGQSHLPRLYIFLYIFIPLSLFNSFNLI